MTRDSAFTEFPVFLEIARLVLGHCACRSRRPAPYTDRIFVTTRGLASYDADRTDIFRRTASYVDRVLRGENPGDLPFQQPTNISSPSTSRSPRRLA
jgi:putative tryptophan/tyrosine transport system substrate-binding protein